MIWVKFLSRVLLSSHTSNRGETDNVTSRYTTHHQQQALQSSHFTTSKTHSGIKSIFYPCWIISPQMIHKPARERSNIYTFHWRIIDWDANQEWNPILYIPLHWPGSNGYSGGLERLKIWIVQTVRHDYMEQLLLSSIYWPQNYNIQT